MIRFIYILFKLILLIYIIHLYNKNQNYKFFKYKKNNFKYNELVAYHEIGHALSANLFKEFFIVNKVKLKSNINGYTIIFTSDKYIKYPNKKYLLANMIVAMSGKAAEFLYNNITKLNKKKILLNNHINLGSYDDFIKSINLAKQYINLFGINHIKEYKKIYKKNNISKINKYIINNEVNHHINYAYNKAIDILSKNYILLIKLSNKLIKYKTLNSSDFNNIKYIY